MVFTAQNKVSFSTFSHEHSVFQLYQQLTFVELFYLPPGSASVSKTQIPHVVYIAAVAPPNASEKFDGKLGMWEISDQMKGVEFVTFCKETLIPELRKQCHWAKSVEVQMD